MVAMDSTDSSAAARKIIPFLGKCGDIPRGIMWVLVNRSVQRLTQVVCQNFATTIGEIGNICYPVYRYSKDFA